VHAGEAYGPESIFQAITELHADRIGHGYYLFATDMISDPSIEDPGRYVDALAEYIADRRITVEVCLTSNLQTNPTLGRMEDHNFGLMRKAKLSTTICTDNRLVSNTTVTRELGLAMDLFELTLKDLRHILIYGFKRSFYAGSYTEKRAYVRSVIDYYERIEREVLVPAYGPLDDEKVS
jgi:adenosine deaminase